jgi:hypothetical protein
LAKLRRRELLSTVAALSLAPAVARASPGPSGRTFMPSLPSAPFPHASRPQYRDSSVGIYVPPSFTPSAAIDAIVHFHGWRNHVAEVFRRYRLREQLDASGRNAVLVVPQGPKDAPDSGFGKLELDDGGFVRFMDDVVAFLQQQGYAAIGGIRNIVLTMHSGGYGGAGGVLTRGGMDAAIGDVLLFDAAYGYYDAFAQWQRGGGDRHLLSLFTDDTATGNAVLMSKVQTAAPNIFVRDASTMTLDLLQTRAPTFAITTEVAHDELLQKLDWYELFLKTTSLRPAAPAR